MRTAGGREGVRAGSERGGGRAGRGRESGGARGGSRWPCVKDRVATWPGEMTIVPSVSLTRAAPALSSPVPLHQYTTRLSSLQDDLDPMPLSTVRAVVTQELLGGEAIESIFKTFDEKPLGSASIAQVSWGREQERIGWGERLLGVQVGGGREGCGRV